MKAVLASASSPGSSCFGSLDFLDSQVAFDVAFSARPVPLLSPPLPLVFLSTLLHSLVPLMHSLMSANFISLSPLFDSIMLVLLLVMTPCPFMLPSPH
jgi:hypothetical protein